MHDTGCNAGGFNESRTTSYGGNGLVVATAATEKIAEFTVLSAKACGCLIGFEAPHTSDPSLDAAVVLLEPVVQVSARPVPDRPTEYGADCPGVGAVAVCRHPVRPKGIPVSVGIAPTKTLAKAANAWRRKTAPPAARRCC